MRLFSSLNDIEISSEKNKDLKNVILLQLLWQVTFFAKNERIWRASCIYGIMGIAFVSVYEVIDIVSIQNAGFTVPLGTLNFIKNIFFSFNVVAGTGLHDLCTDLITKITTIESLLGIFFIFFVVGR